MLGYLWEVKKCEILENSLSPFQREVTFTYTLIVSTICAFLLEKMIRLVCVVYNERNYSVFYLRGSLFPRELWT